MSQWIRAAGTLLVGPILIASMVTASASPEPAPAVLKAPRLAGVTTHASSLLSPPGRQPVTDAPLGLPARVVDAPNVLSAVEKYDSFDGDWNKKSTVAWRIVDGTGNCCENYLSVTKQGMLLDFGGDYIMFSVDDGLKWRRVMPADPLPNLGEGTITVAPNGDIIGVAWNPYYGDRVVPFKYSVADEGWFYTTTKLHQPFFDRESVAVIPGPFEWQGQRFPYLTVLRGGYPFKTPTFYSFDGLNYFLPSARFLDVITEVSDGPLKIEADPMLDWIQPAEQSGITPLGNGTALDRTGTFDVRGTNAEPETAQFSKLNRSTLRWHQFEFKSGALPDRGVLRVDSKGTLHYVVPLEKGFSYMLSDDGGASWSQHRFYIPKDFEVVQLETAVNGKLGIGAVAVQGRNEKAGTNQDWVYKLNIRGHRAELARIYQVGDGKGDYGVGVTAAGNRFDFATMVILPDGRLALSIASSTKGRPNLAIQLYGR